MQRRPRRRLWVAALALALGCGGSVKPPDRAVLETTLADRWMYRRYQKLHDIEVWVAGNPGVAHAASYAHADAEKRGRVGEPDVINVMVTRYRQDRGIAAALVRFARRLASESGYVVEEDEIGGALVVRITGHGEAWVLWPAAGHVVKVGGRGRQSVPADVVEAYARPYPSRLGTGALEGVVDEEDGRQPAEERYQPPAAGSAAGGRRRR